MKFKILLMFFLLPGLFAAAQGPVLYGLASGGGEWGCGAIFSYDVSSHTETGKYQFDGTHGCQPFGSLIQANNGLLYGLTYTGGASNDGVIFSYDISTDTYTDLYDFKAGADGSQPHGSLIQANNGLLYGLTLIGGNDNGGTIFSYDIASGSETVLDSFGKANDGEQPWNSLYQASNGLLYGLTYNAIVPDSLWTGNGAFFSYNITTGKKEDIYLFNQDDSLAGSPYGSVMQANNGLIYGMTTFGNGAEGELFSYNISSGAFKICYTFFADNTGGNPRGALLQANNGLLYGNCRDYGANLGGTVFSYNISTDTAGPVHSFGSGTDGAGPEGTLIQATNGLLYGVTHGGGANGYGIIYSYDISTGNYADVYDFGAEPDGENPWAALLQVNTNTGINPLMADNLYMSVSPDPNNGYFTVTLTEPQNNGLIEIYNVVGEKLLQSISSGLQTTFDLSDQPAGIYFVCLRNRTGTLVNKVVLTPGTY